MNITAWLSELGLLRYAQAFKENEVDAEVLSKLTAEDLRDMGITAVGHRRKLLEAIKALEEQNRAEQTNAAARAAPTAMPVDAERRQLTVLFCDLVGSTELSRKLDPEDLADVIRIYQEACRDCTDRWGGHIAKYLGDGVLAYFGYPTAHEDDAERSVRAGLDMTEAVGSIELGDGKTLAARVGIATGLVMVGELIGEGSAQEETVVGETPNLAARLQAIAEPGSVVIDATCQQLISGLFNYNDLGARDLKGFNEPIQAWRVLGESQAESRFEALRGGHLTTMVGREHEIGLLLDRWERAADGEGQVVLLSGEPGIGKSRIVRALRERLANEAHIPLSHYCSPYHANSPLYPIIGLLERAAGFARDDSAEIRLDKLEALFARGGDNLNEAAPLIATLLEIETADRYPPLKLAPQRQKQRTLEVLVDQVEGLATIEPVLAIYEDVHWIDPSTLDALGLLIERVQRLPILVLVTFRPEFNPPWTGYSHVMQLSLSRLPRRHGQALVTEITGGKLLPAEVFEEILAKTDGVPLFVEELTKTVLESGLLTEVGDHYDLAGAHISFAIPTTLHDSLTARLDRLSPVKEIAQIGAVIGREFSHELIAAVSTLSESKLNAALDQLVAAELVFRRGAPTTVTYSFKHALVQEAAYQSLLKSKRQQLHGAVASALTNQLSEIGEAEPEIVAFHCTEARFTEEAIKHWRNAAEKSAERGAHVEAVAQLEKGLALIRSMPASIHRDHDELTMLRLLGVSLVAVKGFAAPDVGSIYLKAKEICDKLGDDRQLSGIQLGLAVFHMVRGELNMSRSLAEQAYRLAEKFQEASAMVNSQHHLGLTLHYLGEDDLACKHLKQSIDLAKNLKHHSTHYADPHINGLCFLSLALWPLGYPDQAIRKNEEALLLAEQSGDPYTLANTLAIGTYLYTWTRDVEKALERSEIAIALSKKHGFQHWIAQGLIWRGWARVQRQQIERGKADLQEALVSMRSRNANTAVCAALMLWADSCIHIGDVDEAQKALDEQLDLIARTNDIRFKGEAHRLKGELNLVLPKVDRARAEACFEKAIAIANAQGAKTWELRAATSLARFWADQGKRNDAHDLLAPIYNWFTEGFATADLQEAKVLLQELA